MLRLAGSELLLENGWSGIGQRRAGRGAEPQAGPFAETAGALVETFAVAQAFKEAGGMTSGVDTTGFTVNEQQAEGAGPEFSTWHVAFLGGSDGQLDDQDAPDQEAGH